MRSKTRKILAFTICFVLIFCSLPMTAFGAAKTVKQTINLNSTKDLKGAGYNWDASKHTLTLENADLKASGKPIFKLDKKANVKIVLKGENKLSCPDAAVISSGGSKNGGRLTFTGTGSLEVEGYMYINSKEVTVANCKLQVSPAKGVPGIYRSFTNTGSGDFIVTGGAKVTLKDGLNAGAKNDKLIVNGAELNVSSAYFGSTVDVSSDVIVKNGGKLKVSNLYKPAEEEESEGITRFSNGIFTAGNVIFDESSIVDISSLDVYKRQV